MCRSSATSVQRNMPRSSSRTLVLYSDGLCAALAGGTGRSLQHAWPCGAGRPAATEWPGGEPADQRGAGRPGRAGADAARRRRAVERAEGRDLDGAAAWPGAGASAARLGSAEADRLVPSGATTAASAGGHARAAGGLQGGLDAAVAAAKAAHPDRPVEVWAEDEHRLGLKPIRRRVWAPIGQRPIALGHHRYQFFARETGAGRERSIILVLDNAGWHGPKDLAIPDGISFVFLPPYSPELQPAEHLWPLVDEPIANRHVASLDELSTIVAARCRQLDAATLQPHTNFHWWPKPIQPS